MKMHLANVGCGRGKRTTEDVTRVSCLVCQRNPHYVAAQIELDIEREKAFQAQVPKEIREPWHQDSTLITCRVCGGTKFRVGGRTTMGHYQNYVCVCGHVESRLTETGMSF